MEFPVDYYRDEVRCGFYIPTAIKQAWAAGLTVLSEIDKICRRHGITYVADWGTVLGTVRHGGYVPWDDDFDICMRREDYRRFRAVADQELPSEYVIHDYERKEDHWLFLVRVVNNSRISFEEEHLKAYHNFPYLTGVDIFIQDNLYRDPKKEKARCDEIMYILAVAESIIFSTLDKETQRHNLDEIERRYHIRLDRSKSDRDMGIALYRLAEQQMTRVPEEECDEVGQIFPWILKGGKGLPKSYYEDVIRLPFETITMPVPAAYHKFLTSRYGNYLEVRKVWNGHDYPYFEGQRRDLQEVADFELPEYEFDMDVMDEEHRNKMNDKAYSNSIRGIARDCLEEMKRLYMDLSRAVDHDHGIGDKQEAPLVSGDEIIGILESSQQLAVDLGTLIDQVKGEASSSGDQVIAVLQTYCDQIYEVSQNLDALPELGRILEKMDQVIDQQIITKKEVLFLAAGPKLWTGFEKQYEICMQDPETDIYVVALPVFFKDYYGRIQATEEEVAQAAREEEYPDHVKLTSWTEYDITLHAPSVVYIQDVYDEQNPCLTIPAQFYAKRVRDYTKHMVYIPPLLVDEFSSEDVVDLYNMKHYVTAPGVVYADEVLVRSENMKERYLDKLCGWAGEDSREYWNKKLRVDDMAAKEQQTDISGENKKKMLYVIGVNEIVEHKSVVDAIHSRLEIMKNACDTLDTTIVFFPPQEEEWKHVNVKRYDQLVDLIEEYSREEWCTYENLDRVDWQELIKNHHAYYGSASPLVLMFTREKKPVMIADYEVEGS